MIVESRTKARGNRITVFDYIAQDTAGTPILDFVPVDATQVNFGAGPVPTHEALTIRGGFTR